MEIARYLAASTVCLFISYTGFRLLFRKNLNFHLQRAFLVSSVALSVLFPLLSQRISFSHNVANSANTADLYQPLSQVSILQSSNATDRFAAIFGKIKDVLPFVYCTIVALFAMAMAFQLGRIIYLSINSRKIKHHSIVVLENENIKSPFSFLSWIFIPGNLTDEKERNSIIIHENVHAAQWHSIDNLLIETTTAIMWFNPAIWMIRKSLHLIHEYLADEGTLNAGVEKLWYQALLLNQVAEDRLISIPSGFNNKLLKKRMIMMMKSKVTSTRNEKIGLLSFIPLPVFLLLAVTTLNSFFPAETKAQKKEVKKDKTEQIRPGTGNKGEPGNDTIKVRPVKQSNSKEITVIGYGTRNGKEVQRDSTMNYILDGVTVKSISDVNPDSIGSVNVIKEDRLIIVRTKSYERKVKRLGATTGSVVITNKQSSIPDNVLYLIDGKTSTKEELKNIDPSQIESISVIKDKEEAKKYSKEDHDGIIVITTKK
jgi:beta-lactamase regulating signal transducer with metallopeptidase domain